MTENKDISQELFEEIERYLSGAMNPEERNTFENKLQNDSKLKEEVEVQRELILAVEIGSMKNDLEEIHRKSFSAQKKHTFWYGIAASVIVIFSIGIWFVNQESDTDKLFAQYSITEPGLPVPMSATSDYDFHDAMVDYKIEKYDTALLKWEKLLLVNPENDTLNYFMGASHFNLEEYNEAANYFKTVRNQPQSPFYDKSGFYLILSWLKTEEFEKIRTFDISEGSDYKTQIGEIKKGLPD